MRMNAPQPASFEKQNNKPGRKNRPGLLLFLFLLIFTLGALLRFPYLNAPFLDFHPTRQLFSAVKARGMYYQTQPNLPEWQRELAYRQWQREATIEPPLIENLALQAYLYWGEKPAVPRVFSLLCWLAASIFLFSLSKNLTGSIPAALAAFGFFLFLPYTIPASISFQPEPLMILLIVLFGWAFEHWARRPGWGWAALAGIFGGLAIFVKLPAVFFIAGIALGLVPILHLVRNPQTWFMGALGVFPAAIYLYYGLYVARFLGQQFNARFFPTYWVEPAFYLRWLLKLDAVAALPWLVLVVFGAFFLARRPLRSLILTTMLFYAIYGLVFPHHIGSHDYYSLPLVPVLALGLGPWAERAWRIFGHRPYGREAGIALAALALFFHVYFVSQRPEHLFMRAQTYGEIGEKLQHQPGVIALTEDYGYPLAYYGWQNVNLWPPAEEVENFSAAFNKHTEEKAYFVVTDFTELKRQPRLEAKLKTYAIFAQTHDYTIYDLKKTRKRP